MLNVLEDKSNGVGFSGGFKQLCMHIYLSYKTRICLGQDWDVVLNTAQCTAAGHGKSSIIHFLPCLLSCCRKKGECELLCCKIGLVTQVVSHLPDRFVGEATVHCLVWVPSHLSSWSLHLWSPHWKECSHDSVHLLHIYALSKV